MYEEIVAQLSMTMPDKKYTVTEATKMQAIMVQLEADTADDAKLRASKTTEILKKYFPEYVSINYATSKVSATKYYVVINPEKKPLDKFNQEQIKQLTQELAIMPSLNAKQQAVQPSQSVAPMSTSQNVDASSLSDQFTQNMLEAAVNKVTQMLKDMEYAGACTVSSIYNQAESTIQIKCSKTRFEQFILDVIMAALNEYGFGKSIVANEHEIITVAVLKILPFVQKKQVVQKEQDESIQKGSGKARSFYELTNAPEEWAAFYQTIQDKNGELLVGLKQTTEQFKATGKLCITSAPYSDSSSRYSIRLMPTGREELTESEIGFYKTDGMYCKMQVGEPHVVNKESPIYKIIVSKFAEGSTDFSDAEKDLILQFMWSNGYIPDNRGESLLQTSAAAVTQAPLPPSSGVANAVAAVGLHQQPKSSQQQQVFYCVMSHRPKANEFSAQQHTYIFTPDGLFYFGGNEVLPIAIDGKRLIELKSRLSIGIADGSKGKLNAEQVRIIASFTTSSKESCLVM